MTILSRKTFKQFFNNRYFSTFDPILNSSCTLATPITLSGDFTLEVDFVMPTGSNSYSILGGVLGNDFRIVVFGSNHTSNSRRIEFVHNGVFSGTSGAISSAHDGKKVTLVTTRISSTVTQTINNNTIHSTSGVTTSIPIKNIGTNSDLTSFFDGIISNVKITDDTNNTSTTFRLDRPTGNVESSVEGNNSITYNNIPESNRELFTLTNDGWLGQNVSSSLVVTNFGLGSETIRNYTGIVLDITTTITSSSWVGAYLQSTPNNTLQVDFVADTSNTSAGWKLESMDIISGYNTNKLSVFETNNKILFNKKNGYTSGEKLNLTNVSVKRLIEVA